ncbi:MAG: GNAT family N-acetyltransferase [Actinomycetota bacterium]
MPILPVPDGCSLREATVDDVQAVTGLVNEVNVAEVGVPWLGLDEVRDVLTLPTRRPGEHTLLLAADGSLIGYLMLVPDADPFTTARLLSFVPPALWGLGLNAWLLHLGEELARERLEASGGISSIALRLSRWTANGAAVPLFESLGYRYVRAFHDLRIDFDGPPTRADAPNGIAIRNVDRDHDGERVYGAMRDAFADHWGGTFEPFADWKHEELESSTFDPGLWFVAFEGEEVAGALVARDLEAGETPAVYVGSLGVRRPWRGRGIARALLLSLFGEAHRRGYPAVELGVDSENATGATRLYEDVGMRIVRTNEVWEKELRRSDSPAG